MGTLIWILVGMFIGWHFQEPSWAKSVKEKLLGMLQGMFKGDQS